MSSPPVLSDLVSPIERGAQVWSEYFDEGTDPFSVTFDDGERFQRNMPWARFVEASWSRANPATIRIEIGEWQIVIDGHNLERLFEAIETGRLALVRAHPEFANEPEHELDVFATSIRFVHVPDDGGKRSGT